MNVAVAIWRKTGKKLRLSLHILKHPNKKYINLNTVIICIISFILKIILERTKYFEAFLGRLLKQKISLLNYLV
jgi:hypothetical protein